MAITFGIFVVMFMQMQQTRDYYQKTVRPYLFIDPHTARTNKTGQFDLLIKNVGVLPAKEVSFVAVFSPKINEQFKSKGQDPPLATLAAASGAIGGVFPNQSVWEETQVSTSIPEYLTKKPFIHLYLDFQDPAGNQYFFKKILEATYVAPDSFHTQLRWIKFN
jgi:hypothetical protein